MSNPVKTVAAGSGCVYEKALYVAAGAVAGVALAYLACRCCNSCDSKVDDCAVL